MLGWTVLCKSIFYCSWFYKYIDENHKLTVVYVFFCINVSKHSIIDGKQRSFNAIKSTKFIDLKQTTNNNNGGFTTIQWD